MRKFNHKYWDDYYNQVETMESDQYDGWLKKYASVLSRCEKALDLGCGTGINISAILGYCQTLYVADFSPPALELLKKEYANMSVKTFCFDMRKDFPFEDNYFDIVIADLSLHYFNNQELTDILSEIKRVLKIGGFLLARVHSVNSTIADDALPANESGLYIVNGYQRKYFTCAELKTILSSWSIQILEEQTIYRYSQEKQVIEFAAAKS